MISYKKGYKYQLQDEWSWDLVNYFTILADYENQYYWISKEDQRIGAKVGCAWDGATMCPDFDWIMEGSLGHDILHWLIAKGLIPENENDLIDNELAEIIKANAPKSRFKWLLKLRANITKVMTHLVNQKFGKEKKTYTI